MTQSSADASSKAMEVAGRLLARRARCAREISDALLGRAFTPEVVELTLERLTRLGLVGDLAFARAWTEERSFRRLRSPEAIVEELVKKGVERHVAEDAVGEMGLNEESQAVEVAGRLLKKVVHLPAGKQEARLMGMLLRRGFGSEAAATGVRAVLPPEGWD